MWVRAAGIGSATVGFMLARYASGAVQPWSFWLIGVGVFFAGEADVVSRMVWREPRRAKKAKVRKEEVAGAAATDTPSNLPDSPSSPGWPGSPGSPDSPSSPSSPGRLSEAKVERGKAERPRPLVGRGVVEIGLLIASMFAACCVAGPQHGGDDDMRGKLMEILQTGKAPVQPAVPPPGPVQGAGVPGVGVPGAGLQGGGVQGGGVQGPITLQLDPALQAALMGYLTRPAPSQGTGWSGWVSGVGLLMLLIAAGVVVVLLKKPKEAAVVGAAGLSAAAIKWADHLSRMGPHAYGWTVAAYLVVSAAAVGWLGHLIAWRMKRARVVPVAEPAAAARERGKEKEGGDPLLAAAVSVVILLWTAVMVGSRAVEHAEVTGTGEVKTPVQPNAPVAEATEMVPTTLLATARFAAGDPKGALHPEAEWEQTARLREDLERMGGRGDELLLLGSADCTSYRGDSMGKNDALAQRRADAVLASVKATADAKGIFVATAPLTQHKACRESPDQRTVFPILLKPKASGQ